MFKRRLLDVYSATPNSMSVSIAGYNFAQLTARHFDAAEFCQPRLKLFQQRLAEGFAAHGLLTPDSELAYYMWLSFWNDKGWAPWALGARIMLPETSGYIFDCKTAPQHRNRGLYTASLSYARWLCHEAKCKKVLVDVEPLNEPAVRAIKSAGFKKAGATEITKLGPVVRTIHGSDTSFGWKRAAYEF